MQRCHPDYLRALWPSFLVAVITTALTFALVDPAQLHLPMAIAHAAVGWVYSVALLAQWFACWASSALTLWLLTRRPPGSRDVFEEWSGPPGPD